MSNPPDNSLFKRSIAIAASPSRIFKALTDPSELTQWFAEHVDVDLIAGRYRYWGKLSFEIPTEHLAAQVLVSVETDRSLVFQGSLRGHEHVVRWFIEEAEQGSIVHLSHELPGNTETYPWWLLSDQVELWLFNLRQFVESGVPSCLPVAAAEQGSVHVQVTVSASAADAFRAITDPAEMDRWLSKKAQVDLRVGGAMTYGWGELVDGVESPMGPKDILELVPDERLAHSWIFEGEPETVVEWQIVSSGEKTTVKLTHRGFGDFKDVPSYTQGWATFLCRLQSHLEAREGLIQLAA